MWITRAASQIVAQYLAAPDGFVSPVLQAAADGGRWAVLDDAAGIIDSASWLTESAATARADAMNRAAAPALVAAAAEGAAEGRPFYAVLCVNEYEAADGRYFEAFDWAQVPLSLWTLDDNNGGGHYGAESSGSIRTVERLSDGRRIFATGFLATTEEGQSTEALIEQQVLRFVSVDPADYSVEEEITKMGTDGWPIDGRLRFTSYTIGGATVLGNPAIRLAVIWLEGMDAPEELVMPLPEPIPRVEVPEIVDVNDGDVIVIMAAANAVTPEPAEHAAILADSREARALLAAATAERFGETCMLTHDCGGPALPPLEFFADPQLAAPTPLNITPEGRIFGHVALWNDPHRGFLHYELSDRIYAPHNHTDYADFHVHDIPVACCDEHAACGHDREVVRAGVLTVSTGHAGARLTAFTALAHYENTGLAAADVRVGEDGHGIWLSGALRPGMDDARVREVLGASPSGDWRWIRGALELCAVLGVNSGGFPIRASAYVDDGHVLSLITGWDAHPDRTPEQADALVASLAQRYGQAAERSRLQPGVVVVEKARLDRLERDVAEMRPMLAERLTAETAALLAVPS